MRAERCSEDGHDRAVLWSVLGSHVADVPFFSLIRETSRPRLRTRFLTLARPRDVLVQSSATGDLATAPGHRPQPPGAHVDHAIRPWLTHRPSPTPRAEYLPAWSCQERARRGTSEHQARERARARGAPRLIRRLSGAEVSEHIAPDAQRNGRRAGGGVPRATGSTSFDSSRWRQGDRPARRWSASGRRLGGASARPPSHLTWVLGLARRLARSASPPTRARCGDSRPAAARGAPLRVGAQRAHPPTLSKR